MNLLSTTTSLEEIHHIAGALGLSDACTTPLSSLVSRPGVALPVNLSPWFEQRGCKTVGDLIGSPRNRQLMYQMSGRVRKELFRAVRELLADAAASAPAAPEPPVTGLGPDAAAWAQAHGVEEWLAMPIRLTHASKEDLAWLSSYGAASMTVGNVLQSQWPRIPAWACRGNTAGRLRLAASRFLEEQAELLERILLDEERAALEGPGQALPQVCLLWDQLGTARRKLREAVVPAPRCGLEPKIEMSGDPPSLTVVQGQEDLRPDGRRIRPTVVLRFSGEGVACECNCRAKPCGHMIRALGDVQAFLLNPVHAARAAEIATAATRPPWERMLQALDRKLGVTPRTDGHGRRPGLAWHVWRSSVYGYAKLQPYEAAEGRKRGRKLELSDLVDATGFDLLPCDRRLLNLLAPDAYAARRHRELREDLLGQALLLLREHPRLYLQPGKSRSLQVRQSSVCLTIEAQEDGVVLQPTLDGRPVSARELSGPSKVTFDDTVPSCQVVKVSEKSLDVLRLLAERDVKLPHAAIGPLLERLPAIAEAIPVVVPDALKGAQVEADPRPLARLEQAELGGDLFMRVMVRPLPGGPVFVPGEGSEEVFGTRNDESRIWARRNPEVELHCARQLLDQLQLREDPEREPFAWIKGGDEALDLVAALAAQEGLVVEWPAGEARRVARTAMPKDLRIVVKDYREWFGLDGEVEIEGSRVTLAALVAAVQGGRRYVPVKGGTWLRIAEELRDKLSRVAEVAWQGPNGLEVNALMAPALNEAAGEVTIEAPLKWQDLCARIRAAGDFEAPLPQGFQATLRDYQLQGYHWLARLAAWGVGACLADDMGLGKTVQALALLCHRAELGPALVVAPTSVAFNWMRESERFAPGLRPRLFSDRREAALEGLGAGDLVVASYGLLLTNLEAFRTLRFATLVVDEAQAVKNALTKRAKAVRALDAEFRLVMTGTPMENRLSELWSVLGTATPGLLGSWPQFREKFAIPIERDRDTKRQAALARNLRPFVLRRTKQEVAKELPPRTEVRVDVTLSPAERRLYDDARLLALARLESNLLPEEQRRVQVLAELTKLRQLACHPRLRDPGSKTASSKLTRFMEILGELRAEGHRALVFSQFTRHLALVREALDEAGVGYQYLDGSTPESKRREAVDAFQASTGSDVFLISLKAGGFGLNLTAADYVFHLDPWWNPAAEDQATDRAHRIGQDRPVTVYRLVARGTIEEKILELHAQKRELVGAVLDGTDSAPRLTSDELLDLLAAGPPSEVSGPGDDEEEAPSASGLRPPASDLRPPTSDLRPPTSDLRPPASDLRS